MYTKLTSVCLISWFIQYTRVQLPICLDRCNVGLNNGFYLGPFQINCLLQTSKLVLHILAYFSGRLFDVLLKIICIFQVWFQLCIYVSMTHAVNKYKYRIIYFAIAINQKVNKHQQNTRRQTKRLLTQQKQQELQPTDNNPSNYHHHHHCCRRC